MITMTWEGKETEANGTWKLKQIEFYGYQKAKNDETSKILNQILNELKEMKKNHLSLHDTVNNIKANCGFENQKVKEIKQDLDEIKKTQSKKRFSFSLFGKAL